MYYPQINIHKLTKHCRLFIGSDPKGKDFGDVYRMDKFESLVKEVGKFAGRVYCK